MARRLASSSRAWPRERARRNPTRASPAIPEDGERSGNFRQRSVVPESDPTEQPVPTWEEVAREYGGFLYNVAYRLTGNDDDANDLVQEVLLRVRRGLETYTPGSLEGWLSRIATNAFLDEARRRRRRPVVALPDDPDRVVPASAAPDEALAAELLPDDVQRALLTLPEEFRAAVVLCDVVGLSYHEIATALDVPLGTVRSRIHRGRSLLREVLR